MHSSNSIRTRTTPKTQPAAIAAITPGGSPVAAVIVVVVVVAVVVVAVVAVVVVAVVAVVVGASRTNVTGPNPAAT